MNTSVRIDPADPTPPYEQLRRQLSTLIVAGALAEGTRLAPVRSLAADLALATGTVARAYRELESEGLVTTARGAGTRVAAPKKSLTAAQRRSRSKELARQYVESARLLGADDDLLRSALDDALSS